MALNTCEMWFNFIKIAVFSKKLTKNRPTAGDFAPRPPMPLAAGGSAPGPPSVLRLRYTSFLNASPKLDICTFQLLLKTLSLCKIQLKCQPATISDLSSYDIFVPQKVPLLKIFDDVIACDLWFGPPYQSKILATPTNWRLLEKKFWRPFFFGEHLRLCPWSLALASSIPVLGLERVCPQKGCPWPWIFLCPWPWPLALRPRLHLWHFGWQANGGGGIAPPPGYATVCFALIDTSIVICTCPI